MKERGEALGADNGTEGMGRGEVVGARGEEGVMRAALKLQACFEDFGGDVKD